MAIAYIYTIIRCYIFWEKMYAWPFKTWPHCVKVLWMVAKVFWVFWKVAVCLLGGFELTQIITVLRYYIHICNPGPQNNFSK